jgi:hypothetical protein
MKRHYRSACKRWSRSQPPCAVVEFVDNGAQLCGIRAMQGAIPLKRIFVHGGH